MNQNHAVQGQKPKRGLSAIQLQANSLPCRHWQQNQLLHENKCSEFIKLQTKTLKLVTYKESQYALGNTRKIASKSTGRKNQQYLSLFHASRKTSVRFPLISKRDHGIASSFASRRNYNQVR